MYVYARYVCLKTPCMISLHPDRITGRFSKNVQNTSGFKTYWVLEAGRIWVLYDVLLWSSSTTYFLILMRLLILIHTPPTQLSSGLGNSSILEVWPRLLVAKFWYKWFPYVNVIGLIRPFLQDGKRISSWIVSVRNTRRLTAMRNFRCAG